jgi:hypothetical protein
MFVLKISDQLLLEGRNMSLEYVKVTSSTIDSVAYSSGARTLGVKFVNGTEYHYFEVPESVFDGLLSASSVGSYFHSNVRKAGYNYTKVQ